MEILNDVLASPWTYAVLWGISEALPFAPVKPNGIVQGVLQLLLSKAKRSPGSDRR